MKTCRLSLLALGIVTITSGPFFTWNLALSAGFGSYIISTILLGSAYCIFCLCASELSSAFPFAGGSYGLARCTLGYYLGFMTGCCEILFYITCCSFIHLTIAQMLCRMIPSFAPYQPLIWFVNYFLTVFLNGLGGSVFWATCWLIAIFTITILAIHNFGRLFNANFSKYAYYNEDFENDLRGGEASRELFVGGVAALMKWFPYNLYMYGGSEVLNLACDEVEFPRSEVPWSQTTCMLLMACQSIVVMFVVTCSEPGINEISLETFPLSSGQDPNELYQCLDIEIHCFMQVCQLC
jgi:ethanolamine permease